MTTPRIIIIGSGIMGACFAYAAAQRGLSPVIIASDAPDNGKTGIVLFGHYTHS